MANVQNLRPGEYKLTHEEQKKGGKASVAARRRKKTLAENMKTLLELPIKSKADLKYVAGLGVPEEDIDNSQLLVIALFNRAKEGDVSAFKEIRSMIGEENIQSTEQIDKLDAVLEQIGGVI